MLPLTPYPDNLLPTAIEDPEAPDTPSSTMVEYGDNIKKGHKVPSAAELAARVFESYTGEEIETPIVRPKSRSRSETREARERRERSTTRNTSKTNTPVPRNQSQSSNHRNHSSQEMMEVKALSIERGSALERELASSRVNRFLQSITVQAPVDPDKELLLENRGLYQRVAALQRTERELMADNQDLMRQYATLKQHHDVRRKQWREDFRLREKTFEAQINQLKQQIAKQQEQLAIMAATHTKKVTPMISDEEIASWLSDNSIAWHSWAQEFASDDPNRLTRGLHPAQLSELCEGSKSFVKLTDDNKLPDDLLANGSETVPALLHGMLANFICTETLASPFWVFNALSTNTVESPSIQMPRTVSPAGFRMDLAKYNDVAPLRSAACAHTPGSPLFPPPLITSLIPALGMGPSGFPMRLEMANFHNMLSRAQDEDAKIPVHEWRAQMMRLLVDGGIDLKDPQDAGRNEARRNLIDSRLNYARRLKERFLGGAARFLLQDQTPRGIEKLERRLTDRIDDALRFSCKIWSQPAPVRLYGLKDLGGKEYKPSSKLMRLCRAQAPARVSAARQEGSSAGSHSAPNSPPPGYHDGRPVIMVVQPAIETVEVVYAIDGEGPRPEHVSKIWLKARVLVEAPERPAIHSVTSGSPTPAKSAKSSGKSSVLSPSGDSPLGPVTVLPASSYNPAPGQKPKISFTAPPIERPAEPVMGQRPDNKPLTA